MQLVFWQNILSPHQAPFLRALPALGYAVTIVAGESLTADRLAMGWTTPDLGKARVVIGPAAEEIGKLIEGSDNAAIHIMAGARWTPLGDLACKHLLKHKRRLGVLSESPDPRGLPGYGRRIKYGIERMTKGSQYDFIFAMGEMGARWFERCGYAKNRIFPFAYVTDSTAVRRENDAADEISILYCGQFIHRKGLDVLLRAFAAVPSPRVKLQLLGAGPEKEQLEHLVPELGLQHQVAWRPKRDASGVLAEMERADVTVLPSRHDGWGAVVNESLMMGTPVICSNACGASELIRQPWLGSVFSAGNVAELAQVLRTWIDRGRRSPAERERIRSWSQRINGEEVARYFVAIMQHIYAAAQRPVAPWRLDA